MEGAHHIVGANEDHRNIWIAFERRQESLPELPDDVSIDTFVDQMDVPRRELIAETADPVVTYMTVGDGVA